MTGINSAVTGKFSDPPVIMTGITSIFISRPGGDVTSQPGQLVRIALELSSKFERNSKQMIYLFDLTEASSGFLNTSCIIVKVLQYSFSVLSISCAITERLSPNDNLSLTFEFYN